MQDVGPGPKDEGSWGAYGHGVPTPLRATVNQPAGGALPYSWILGRYETTGGAALSEGDGELAFRNSVIGELVDRRPDAPALESDYVDRDRVTSVAFLNSVYNGQRGAIEDTPHTEAFFAFTDPDPRGTTDEPDYRKMRQFGEARAREMTARMGDNVGMISDSPWTAMDIAAAEQRVRRQDRDTRRVFSRQVTRVVGGDTRALPAAVLRADPLVRRLQADALAPESSAADVAGGAQHRGRHLGAGQGDGADEAVAAGAGPELVPGARRQDARPQVCGGALAALAVAELPIRRYADNRGHGTGHGAPAESGANLGVRGAGDPAGGFSHAEGAAASRPAARAARAMAVACAGRQGVRDQSEFAEAADTLFRRPGARARPGDRAGGGEVAGPLGRHMDGVPGGAAGLRPAARPADVRAAAPGYTPPTPAMAEALAAALGARLAPGRAPGTRPGVVEDRVGLAFSGQAAAPALPGPPAGVRPDQLAQAAIAQAGAGDLRTKRFTLSAAAGTTVSGLRQSRPDTRLPDARVAAPATVGLPADEGGVRAQDFEGERYGLDFVGEQLGRGGLGASRTRAGGEPEAVDSLGEGTLADRAGRGLTGKIPFARRSNLASERVNDAIGVIREE
jgi:hypothetical protein